MARTKTLDEILATIANHLARADHPNTPPAEADLARSQAEKMMAKYRVEEWEAAQAGETAPLKPLWANLSIVRYGNEWLTTYQTLAYLVFAHTGVKTKFTYGHDTEGFTTVEATLLGFESDVRYAEMLWAGIRLSFSKRLEPSFDPMESDAANAYRMRAGGMERNRIALALLGSWETTNEMKQKTRKVTALIRQGATEVGANPEDLLGRGNNIKAFRITYASSFVAEMGRRLRLLRTESGLASSAVVLSNRTEALDDVWYERFPGERLVPVSGAVTGPAPEPCQRCKRAKSGYCREHRPVRWTSRAQAYSDAGARHGRQAAREVDLGAAPARSIG